MTRKYSLMLLLLALIVAVVGGPVIAQGQPVTADEINAVAKRLYCPTCENIPLDTCGTSACIDWRAEIGVMLSEGLNEQEIINAFVAQYGERVAATPQDPSLRALSLVTPYVIAFMALGIGIFTFTRWQRNKTGLVTASIPVTQTDADYRARLEHDLQERR